MERENLKSRLGFILLSAGCAIGIGNVWRFPYVVGNYGGGIFVLFYLFFLALIGIPVLTIEFSIGRASQKSTAKALAGAQEAGKNINFGHSLNASFFVSRQSRRALARKILHLYYSKPVNGKTAFFKKKL